MPETASSSEAPAVPEKTPVARGAPPERLVLGAAHTRLGERELPHMRAWFVGFVLWMAAWGLLARWAFGGVEHDDPTALRVWVYALMCFYLSLCNSFVPLPTAWIVLLAASPGFALCADPWLRVLLVAAGGAAGTVMANLNDYHLLAYFLHFGLGHRVRRTRLYAWAVRWFDRAPLRLLLLVAFIPIPVDVVRWLAVLREYPRGRFALAYFVGRGARYAIFAACAVIWSLTPWQIMYIQLAIVVAALVGRVAWRLAAGREPAAGAASSGA